MNEYAPEVDGSDTQKRQFVSFRVHSRRYGIPIESVAEMTQIHDFHPISGTPAWILGMMQLRNSVIPILDLRIRLGLSRLEDELARIECDLTRQQQDHVDWVRSLEQGCAAGAILETDHEPIRCSLQACLESLGEGDEDRLATLERLREPDARLHAAVASCRTTLARGDVEATRRALRRIRNEELGDLRDAIDRVVREIRARGRQMIIVLRGADESLGIAVDHIDSVTGVETDQIVPRPLHGLEAGDASADVLVSCVVRRHDRSALVQILDVERVFRTAGVIPVDPASIPVEAGEPAGA